MSNDLRNRDTLEKLYHKTFHSEEVDVPEGFTDAVMSKLEVKNSWSQKIGAKKLFRYLKISLVFNLVTVGTLSYYLLNNKVEVIKIDTPLENIIVNEQELLKPELEEQEKTNGAVRVERMTKVKDVNSPIIKEKKKKPSESKTVNKLEPNMPLGEEIKPVNVDSLEATEEIYLDNKEEQIVNEKLENNEPKSLIELRSKLKDTLTGKKLFQNK